jgi:hypothetical protein
MPREMLSAPPNTYVVVDHELVRVAYFARDGAPLVPTDRGLGRPQEHGPWHGIIEEDS